MPGSEPAATVGLVGLVLVSHSAGLADGVAELLRPMAPDVTLLPAGGDDEGGLGTSFDRISAALGRLGSEGGVVLYDLGSALLSTETALEFLDPDQAAKIEIVDAPLVEGALAAGVAAQGGASLAEVAAAARGAGAPGSTETADGAPGSAEHADGAPGSAEHADDAAAGSVVTRVVRLRNALGLHARPAATLVQALRGVQAAVTLARPNGSAVDARSLLAVVRLATRAGDELEISATGPDRQLAVARAAELIQSGFGELDGASPVPAGALAGAPGRAIGPLRRLAVTTVTEQTAGDPGAERALLADALAGAESRLRRGGDPLSQAHAALLSDPGLRADAETALGEGWSA
ncbi:MAG TPA: dihydroxyacetone kinase phosphoryl donor subunit DhaM, partial [Jatrophihabitans sp.]|nr:dihydroxyacetone kinase phosphoryl donor subunit DhaM [Jatrophihabitans sp.]